MAAVQLSHGKMSAFHNMVSTKLMKEEWPQEGIDLHIWDHTKGEENIAKAEAANVGITISDVTLAESGTAVLFSSKDKGKNGQLFTGHFHHYYPKKQHSSPHDTSGPYHKRKSKKRRTNCLMH